VYNVSHLFSEPLTATKYIGTILLLVVFLFPVILVSLVSLVSIDSYGQTLVKLAQVFFTFDPLITFAVGIWNVSTANKITL